MPRDARHDAYEKADEHYRGMMGALRELGERGDAFSWEIEMIRGEVGVVSRYLSKIKAVLYCTFPDCRHEDKALAKGEGVAFFEGRVHADCREAYRRRSTG